MKPYVRVALWYFVFGTLWILFSDAAAAALTQSTRTLSLFQTVKGWLFVIISAGFVYQLTKRAFEDHQRQEAEKLALYRSTVGGAHHILLNYLNQMQLVTLEAERSLDFDKSIVKLSSNLSQEAAGELAKLESIEVISAAQINSVIYPSMRSR
jgi:DNA-directed RNA polymerase subunit F